MEYRDLRLYRHRKRGSIEHVVGMVELAYLTEPVSDNAELKLYRSSVGLELIEADLEDSGNVFLVDAKTTVKLQTDRPVENGDIVVLYHDNEFNWWARLPDEFYDGRFERLTHSEHEDVFEDFAMKVGYYYE